MVESVNVPDGSPPEPPRAPRAAIWPTAANGWIALVAAVVGLGSWVVLPIITTLFAERYPVTNTFVMPAIGTVLILVAAVLNVLSVWLWKQRSVLNIVAMAVVSAAAIFFTFIVVGEGIAGA
jgi:hypothetical protein